MTMENDDIFTETPVETTTVTETPVPENAYESLVGEGRKYRDQEALAKAALEKDNFIERLKREQEEARKELEKRLTIDEFMNKLEQKRMESQTGNTETPSVESLNEEISKTNNSLTREEIDALVEERLKSQSTEQLKNANLGMAIQEIQSLWGDQANVRLNQKASELGISVQKLKEYAMESPKVFLSMVGASKQAEPQTGRSVFQSTVDTTKQPPVTGEKTKSYYDKLRREDPKLYFKASTQNEMHKQALKLKEDFFK